MSIINKIIPVLLCGGSGSRLWPKSRESFPKQYLKFNLNNNRSFLQETQNRLLKLKNIERPILICNEEHRFIVAEQMLEINIQPQSVILEPFGRNTAPAITIAAIKALEKLEDPLLLILPADHSIKDVSNFIETIEVGFDYANQDKILTFGIPPKGPETGYGYIEAQSRMDFYQKEPVKIRQFLEKPSLNVAKTLIRDTKYVWNSGIFLLKAKVVIQEIKKFFPEIYISCLESINNSNLDLDFIRLQKESFEKCPNESFDIAIMEKTKLGYVLPLNVGWNDVGNWNSIWEISEKDNLGNAISGNIFLEDSKKSYLISENRLIVALGIENLIVVDTQDAILIADKKFSQNVKNIVSKLKDQKYEEAKKHRKIFRPWGSYLSLSEDLSWQVKKINVNPGASLSLQKHRFRTEHWIIVSGIAKVELEGKTKILKENESTYIPLGYKHRLSNPGKELLILIEVQSGSYLGEDDIVRFEDNYGRRETEPDKLV